MPTQTTVCIVGAGAAGLWAAAACARRGVPTLVLEKTRRTGTKVLSSGGSRCNLTTTLGPEDTARAFAAGHNFILPALMNLPPAKVRAHFEDLGVKTKIEPEFQKVFPASDSALQVRDAMLRDAQQAGAQFRLDTQVQSIHAQNGGWVVQAEGVEVHCEKLLLCTGGKSYPQTGTTGDGYVWLRTLGLRVVDPVPALVPLASPAPWIHEMSGVSVDGELRIGKHRRRRPVLFTHKGLSGPAAMDLSEQVTRNRAREAKLDLLPDISWEQLRALLVSAAGRPGSPRLASLLPLSRKVLAMACVQAGLEPNPQANQLNKAARHHLIETLKALPIPLSGSLGFAKAEVTSGGLHLKEVHRGTMQVAKHPGLYVFGEMLDLSGPIGGFNFQAAFATAELAAAAACK